MANQKVMVLGGINVVAVDSDSLSCSGCCFDHRRTCEDGCTVVENCYDVIYKKVEDMEQKFTLDEFFKMWDKCYPDNELSGLQKITLRRVSQNVVDPEYKEFLRLKEKFQE